MTIVKILSISTAKEVTNVVFENLKFKKTLTVPKIGSVPLYAMIQKGSGEFEILSGDDVIVIGKVTVPQAGDKFLIEDTKFDVVGDVVQLSGADIYSEFNHRGHKYSGLFKSIKSLTLSEEGTLSITEFCFLLGVYVDFRLDCTSSMERQMATFLGINDSASIVP